MMQLAYMINVLLKIMGMFGTWIFAYTLPGNQIPYLVYFKIQIPNSLFWHTSEYEFHTNPRGIEIVTCLRKKQGVEKTLYRSIFVKRLNL